MLDLAPISAWGGQLKGLSTPAVSVEAVEGAFLAHVAAFAQGVRLLNVCQGQHRGHNRLEVAAVYQGRQGAQRIACGRNGRHKCLAHTVGDGRFLGRRLYHRDQHPTWLQYAPRARLRVAPDRIQHQVHLMHHRFKRRGVVINGLIHPQLAQEVEIVRRRCADHRGTAPFGQLHRQRTHATGRAVNQHRLPSRQAAGFDEGTPGGKTNVRQRRCLKIVEGSRFVGHF